MAKKENTDKGFSEDVHIRLTAAEAKRLKAKANELGIPLSKAGRILMFKRADSAVVSGEGSIRQQLAQSVSSLKNTFKKYNAEIVRLVADYEKSLTVRNHSGEPAVSTRLTLQAIADVVANQMKIQDGLNEVVRHLGGGEVHVAAKPPVGTAVGDYVSGRKKETEKTRPEAAPAKKDEIPYEFITTMANITILGVLVAEPESYQNGKYEMIRLVVQVEERSGTEKKYYRVDCTDFKSRYNNIMEYLKPEKKVLVAGDFRFTLGTYNGKPSDSRGTVVMSDMRLV